jgi:hypothetical protein
LGVSHFGSVLHLQNNVEYIFHELSFSFEFNIF